MYDDRLEVTSPGGMVDGSQIQNLDLTKIPSLRRNTILSDVFSRLHFMERRGSGLTRIIESYSDCNIKPKFTSGISNFTVIFPNKGYLFSHPKEIEIEKNIVTDEEYFFLKMYKNLAGKVRTNFIISLQELFNKVGYDKEFNRETIEKYFGVKKSRALEIISILIDCDIAISTQGSKYKLKK